MTDDDPKRKDQTTEDSRGVGLGRRGALAKLGLLFGALCAAPVLLSADEAEAASKGSSKGGPPKNRPPSNRPPKNRPPKNRPPKNRPPKKRRSKKRRKTH